MFRNARLCGSWDVSGHHSDNRTETPLQEVVGEDGFPTFTASISFDLADRNRIFKWGVVLEGPQGSNFWDIPTKVPDINSAERYRVFKLSRTAPQVERYYFTHCRRLGANKYLFLRCQGEAYLQPTFAETGHATQAMKRPS
ncbi:MAG: Alpha amylase catalytic region [Nitrospira sp.]|jgi:1,4-alpha-glucan branching enzyme|nr:Alpha amylase catalytic region [Nitrospira sp.]MCE3222508.1 Alpha amylase catalytic region [Nitrospira sp.]